MNRRVLSIKLILSAAIISLSVISIVYAWSPLFVTYVPVEQAYYFSSEQAQVVEDIIASGNESHVKVLKVSTVLILINLLVSLAVLWVAKFNANKNT